MKWYPKQDPNFPSVSVPSETPMDTILIELKTIKNKLEEIKQELAELKLCNND